MTSPKLIAVNKYAKYPLGIFFQLTVKWNKKYATLIEAISIRPNKTVVFE